jgi:hypothetical protein
MPRYVFFLASLIVAALGIGTPASAQSLSVSEFLARCDTDQPFCQDEVARVERISNAIPGANCPPEGWSIETITTAVVGALKNTVEEHPENASVNSDEAIGDILPSLWPCPN